MTIDEFNYLKQFDSRFETLIKSQYMSSIQSSDIDKIYEIYKRISKQELFINKRCSTCIAKLMRLIYPYYADKKERLTQKNNECEGTLNTEGSVEEAGQDQA